MNIAKRIISLIIFLALFAVSALRINTVLNYQDALSLVSSIVCRQISLTQYGSEAVLSKNSPLPL